MVVGAGLGLLCALAAVWWFVSAQSPKPVVHLRFLHYTNSTDRLSSDELAVFETTQFRPHALPPPTHAVLQLTNSSAAVWMLLAVSVSGVYEDSKDGQRRVLDSAFAGVPRIPRQLAPGEAADKPH